jgi:hypothetical protein
MVKPARKFWIHKKRIAIGTGGLLIVLLVAYYGYKKINKK